MTQKLEREREREREGRVQTDGPKQTRTDTAKSAAPDRNRLSCHASLGFITYAKSGVQDSQCPFKAGIRTNAE